MPLYPTRGQQLPYRGSDMEKTSFPPLQQTSKEVLGSNPVSSKNYFSTKFDCRHEGMILKLTFPSHFLPLQLARCYLDPSFLLFLFPLESLIKLYVVPRNFTYRLSYLSVLFHSHKPHLVNFPVRACFVGTKNSNNLYSQLLCELCPHCTSIFWHAG